MYVCVVHKCIVWARVGGGPSPSVGVGGQVRVSRIEELCGPFVSLYGMWMKEDIYMDSTRLSMDA